MFFSTTRLSTSKALRQTAPDEIADRVNNIAEGMIKREATTVVKQFQRFTATWNHQPVFEVEVERHSNDMVIVQVSTDDEIFYYIDQGTSVRYATMTEDFEPKTKPKRINSTNGNGGLAFVSRNRPRPGIQAREITRTIYLDRQPKFSKNVSNGMSQAIIKYWRTLWH